MPITFPRAGLATRDVLRVILADAYPSATVSTKTLPGGDGDRPIPYVQTRGDGRSRTARLDGRALVRVSVWAEDEGAAEELAALIEALLLDYEGGPEIRGFTAGAGPLTTFDEEAGLWLAFFSITARLRPGSTP